MDRPAWELSATASQIGILRTPKKNEGQMRLRELWPYRVSSLKLRAKALGWLEDEFPFKQC